MAPPASAALLYGNENAVAAIRLWIKVSLLWLLLVLLAYILLVVLDGPAAARARETAIQSIAIAAAVVLAVRLTAGRRRFPGALDGALIVALALAVFALSPFSPYGSVPIGLLDYALGAPRFWLWLLVGAAWTATGIWLRCREGWAFAGKRRVLEAVAICVAGGVVLLLYDDLHFTDFSHYMPLVGPALHAARGGTPMVDVYSVYGLGPWLVHLAAFELFTPTFGTAAVTVRVINLLYYGTILAMLVFVTRRRLSALWFFIPAILVALTSHGGMWNMNALPMTLGGRNLLPAVVALLMVASRDKGWGRWAALPLIMLASLSSVEILIFALAPWGYCLLLELGAGALAAPVRHVGGPRWPFGRDRATCAPGERLPVDRRRRGLPTLFQSVPPVPAG